MYWYHSNFFGMHVFWWVFWALLIIAIFAMAPPVSRKRTRLYREDPLAILQRRYATGEIKTDEYEERKTRLTRDLNDPKLRPFSRNQNAPA